MNLVLPDLRDNRRDLDDLVTPNVPFGILRPEAAMALPAALGHDLDLVIDLFGREGLSRRALVPGLTSRLAPRGLAAPPLPPRLVGGRRLRGVRRVGVQARRQLAHLLLEDGDVLSQFPVLAHQLGAVGFEMTVTGLGASSFLSRPSNRSSRVRLRVPTPRPSVDRSAGGRAERLPRRAPVLTPHPPSRPGTIRSTQGVPFHRAHRRTIVGSRTPSTSTGPFVRSRNAPPQPT